MRNPRGGGKFEFLLVVALFGILAAALLDRLVGIEQAAERTEVDLTLRNMRVGLQLAVGERLMRGQEHRLAELVDTNPVGLLGRLPAGYRGETAISAGPGTWNFDPASHTLAYRPRQPEVFGGRAELRWRIVAQAARDGRIQGIALESRVN